MGVDGFGFHLEIIDTFLTPINIVAGSDMFHRGAGIPSPGVAFIEDVHTNSKGMRVLVRRDDEGFATSIAVWGEDQDDLSSMTGELDRLRIRIHRNNGSLSNIFTSWIEE